MNGLRFRRNGRADDALLIQIAVLRRRLADADGFIGQRHVDRFRVRLGIHRHGADAHFLAGTNNAHRDFAAVRDKQFRKHSLFLSAGLTP